MLTRRVLFTSLCATIVGVAFAIPAFSAPPVGAAGPGSQARFRPSTSYFEQYTQGAYNYSHSGTTAPRRFAGYPCTWSGSRDLAHGETAYRSGRYVDAIAQWKAAASKDCAIAAYKLGMLYYGGESRIAADRSLGTAWLKVAADSSSASSPYYQEMSDLAVGTLTKPQRAEYTADYAKLQASLGLPTAE